MLKKAFTPTVLCSAFAAASFLAASCPVTAQQAPVALTIHADQPTTSVSPTLYGLMTEEINYSYEGGLYADMVSNRTFRGDWSGIHNWYLVEKGTSNAAMLPDETTGPSEALKTSLKLDVKQADAHSQAGVINTGWWGYELHPNTEYKGSFYAKVSDAAMGPVTIALVGNQSGAALASATVNGVGTDWKQYTFTLKTGAIQAASENHLVISVGHAGSLWLQLVSVFPPTYHNRPRGFRVDLMEKLAAMHPQFLRFPGGNYVEGNTIAQRFDWKKTIGPMVDRPGHESPWGYWSTDDMGLLEFLDWCEDLKMQPVLAVYAGYSLHGEHVNPGADLQPYVQDALDEIEYVSGSTDTKWGAQRAKDGHPEPFKLTYVEIGNEEWFDRSGSYGQRYAQFVNAIRGKYPDLKIIATAPVKDPKPDVVDEHYYVRATENFKSADHYDASRENSAAPLKWEGGHFDKADRNGPKVFVGEWATREGTPTPNMGAALGDAAWMTGLERNSDQVIMASYAPLLVNVNPGGMQWETDLIGYDAASSYGSPAYYAQAMFASHLGDHTLASQAEGAGPRFFYSITGSAAHKKLYLKLVNADSTPQPVNIDFAGAKLAPTATLMSLSGKSTQATNSITQPRAIVPTESSIPLQGSRLRHTMPGYSIQVIVLTEQ